MAHVVCGILRLHVVEARDLPRGDWFSKSDPYVKVFINSGSFKQPLGRSRTVKNDSGPVWNWEFSTMVQAGVQDPSDADDDEDDDKISLEFRVYDDDDGGEESDDFLGLCTMPFSDDCREGKQCSLDLWLELKNKHGGLAGGELHVKIDYVSMLFPENDYANENVVPNTYFMPSVGNMVTLYHDADVCPYLRNAKSAWKDLSIRISEAQHFIFICGWSVFAEIQLVRADASSPTIGEQLKQKASEGVLVCLLLWNDPLSTFYKNGFMSTYDEVTKRYFADSEVRVVLARRELQDDQGLLAQFFYNATFTHHQKSVILDSHGMDGEVENNRVLRAFVGGLDITGGRYDTQEHSLFRTLETTHARDFYNGCLTEATVETGPRQPWHDIHCQVVGPAAWDVLENFLERADKQATDIRDTLRSKIRYLKSEGIVRRREESDVVPEGDAREWNVQVFRSIDSQSAVFQADWAFTRRFENSDVIVEKTIHQAYVYKINTAKRFLYIENQYFIGSAQKWSSNRNVPCNNLVPWAITQRIVRAIKKGEAFACYVIIPLFPEGAPESAAVQEVLHWQFQTMRMMYREIGKAIGKTGRDDLHPKDFLNFFFIGKREHEEGCCGEEWFLRQHDVKMEIMRLAETVDDEPAMMELRVIHERSEMPPAYRAAPSAKLNDLLRALESRRHQIYVHSKMMIVDDEYIILGSANINDRSLSGNRDSEVAAGCFQKCATCFMDGDNVVMPNGAVSHFRKSLWKEHLGLEEPDSDFWLDPGSTDCARWVLGKAQENWEAYMGDEVRTLPNGHLCPYPIVVDPSGNIGPLEDCPNFPDTKAPVIGTPSALMHNLLTT